MMCLRRAILFAGALGLALLHAPLHAESLGRLFFTPEQRAMLDLARRTQATAVQDDTASDGVTLSGIVTRSDGRRTVWINGRPQPAGVATGRSPSSASIPLPGGGGQVRLRVGQTLDPTSGKVEEGYRRPRPPAPQSPTGQPAAEVPKAKPAKPASAAPAEEGDDAGAPEPGADSGR
jgi:hypothetical protein